MSADRCRGCQAPILWIQTETGKSMPLEAEVVTSTNPRAVLYSKTGTRLQIASFGQLRTGHLPHWASCPERARFKRRPPTKGSTDA